MNKNHIHIAKRTKYYYLDAGANDYFFDIGSIYGLQTMLYAYAGPQSFPLHMLINKEIFDIILGNIMFHPKYLDGIPQSRFMESFVLTLDYSEDAADIGDISRYAIIISKTKQFQLVAQYLAAGM